MDQLLKRLLRLTDLALVGRRGRIDDRRIQHLAGRINDSQLASGTECRVPSKHVAACDRRLHQQLLQVLAKHSDCAILGLLGKIISDLTLDGRLDQPVITVLYRLLQNTFRVRIRIFTDNTALQVTQDLLFGRQHLNRQDLLLLPPVQRQNSVPHKLLDRLLKLIVHLIDRRRLRILGLRTDISPVESKLSDLDTIIRLVRYALRDYVLRPLKSVLHREHFLLLRNKGLRLFLQRLLRHLQHDDIRQRLQTLFLRDGRPGPPFRTERAVKIIHHDHGERFLDLLFQLGSQLALFFNTAEHLRLLILQIAKISKPLIQCTKLLIIQRARHFLTIPGNKRNRVALINKLHRGIHLLTAYIKFLCNYL